MLETKLGVISDEIYEQLVYGDAKATCFATLRPGLAERTITISGVSKSYAMTGWRMGWAMGPVHVIKAMGNVQSQETSCPSSISQYATLAALEGDQKCVEDDAPRSSRSRRDLVCRRLRAMPGIRCPMPEGAFYAFFNVAPISARRSRAGRSPTRELLPAPPWKRVHVNLVPGSAFGAEGYVGYRSPRAGADQ